LIVVGVQLLSLGLLAQIMVLNRREASGAAVEHALVSALIGVSADRDDSRVEA
jgi:hypothetical protein